MIQVCRRAFVLVLYFQCALDLNARNSYEDSALNVAVSAGYADIEEFLQHANLPKVSQCFFMVRLCISPHLSMYTS